MLPDLRVEELREMRLEALVRAFLIRPHQSRIPRHIRGKDRGETAARGHPFHPALRMPSSQWSWSSGRIQGMRSRTYMAKDVGAMAIACPKTSLASSMRPDCPSAAASQR